MIPELKAPASNVTAAELRKMASQFRPEDKNSPTIYGARNAREQHDAFVLRLDSADPKSTMSELYTATIRDAAETHRARKAFTAITAAGAVITAGAAAVGYHPLAFAGGTGVAALVTLGSYFHERDSKQFTRNLVSWAGYINTSSQPAPPPQPEPTVVRPPKPTPVQTPPLATGSPAEQPSASAEPTTIQTPIRSKPPTKEDEYFARLDRELIEQARRKKEQQQAHS